MSKGVVLSYEKDEGVIRDEAGTEYRIYRQGIASSDLHLIKPDVEVRFEQHPKQKSGTMLKAWHVTVCRPEPVLPPQETAKPSNSSGPQAVGSYSRKTSHTGNRSNGPSSSNRGSDSKQKNPPIYCDQNPDPFPYHFVRVPTDSEGKPLAVEEAPIFHHGRNHRQTDLVSGELRCTLTALTPLLVGNYQFEVKDLQAAEEQDGRYAIQGIGDSVDAGKKILAPLRLKTGEILISGTSLKGMVRQSIGALLAAPMERVAEKTFSYRPNLAITKGDELRWSAALVISELNRTTGGNLNVRLVRIPQQRDPNPFMSTPFNPNGKDESSGMVRRYMGGIDGKGLIHSISNEAKKKKMRHGGKREEISPPKHKVLIEGLSKRSESIPVDASIVLHYWDTLNHLADTMTGHLSSVHPEVKEEKKDNYGIASRDDISKQISSLRSETLKFGDVIYVEYKIDEATGKKVVTSIGHHFRYRWKYKDTVRTLWKGAGVGRKERSILVSSDAEKSLSGGKPERLTGARLLFGYVRDNDPQSGTKGIGEGNYKRLAGRIAFNTAVERIADGRKEADRFLNSDKGFLVPLKTLGMPRASAVECYLQQQPIPKGKTKGEGTLVTYGDLADDQASGGELNGRKFYLHQPDAENNSRCFQSENEEEISGNQAPLALYVSKRETEFRFTVRFRDLRTWELGALLFALDPNHVEDVSGGPRETILSLKGLRSANDDKPCFACKLGHGRPLGMGSVRIHVDTVLPWNEGQEADGEQLRKQALTDFWQFIANKYPKDVLVQWFTVHQYRGRTRAKYPTHVGEIFSFHTKLRQEHAKARRMRVSDQNPCVLKPL